LAVDTLDALIAVVGMSGGKHFCTGFQKKLNIFSHTKINCDQFRLEITPIVNIILSVIIQKISLENILYIVKAEKLIHKQCVMAI